MIVALYVNMVCLMFAHLLNGSEVAGWILCVISAVSIIIAESAYKSLISRIETLEKTVNKKGGGG